MSNLFHKKSIDSAVDVIPTRPDSLLYSGHGLPPPICLVQGLFYAQIATKICSSIQGPKVSGKAKALPRSCIVVIPNTLRSVQHLVSRLLFANTGVSFIAIQKNTFRKAA